MTIVKKLLQKMLGLSSKTLNQVTEEPQEQNENTIDENNPLFSTPLYKALRASLKIAVAENNIIAVKTIIILQGILLDQSMGKVVSEMQFNYLLQLYYKQRCYNENFEKDFLASVPPQGNA